MRSSFSRIGFSAALTGAGATGESHMAVQVHEIEWGLVEGDQGGFEEAVVFETLLLRSRQKVLPISAGE